MWNELYSWIITFLFELRLQISRRFWTALCETFRIPLIYWKSKFKQQSYDQTIQILPLFYYKVNCHQQNHKYCIVWAITFLFELWFPIFWRFWKGLAECHPKPSRYLQSKFKQKSYDPTIQIFQSIHPFHIQYLRIADFLQHF